MAVNKDTPLLKNTFPAPLRTVHNGGSKARKFFFLVSQVHPHQFLAARPYLVGVANLITSLHPQ